VVVLMAERIRNLEMLLPLLFFSYHACCRRLCSSSLSLSLMTITVLGIHFLDECLWCFGGEGLFVSYWSCLVSP
jgi:hypothetical protein